MCCISCGLHLPAALGQWDSGEWAVHEAGFHWSEQFWSHEFQAHAPPLLYGPTITSALDGPTTFSIYAPVEPYYFLFLCMHWMSPLSMYALAIMRMRVNHRAVKLQSKERQVIQCVDVGHAVVDIMGPLKLIFTTRFPEINPSWNQTSYPLICSAKLHYHRPGLACYIAGTLVTIQ